MTRTLPRYAPLLVLLALLLALPASAFTFATATATLRQYPEHGHLASNGEIGEYVFLPSAGEYNVDVVAAGMPMGGIWPEMALRVNGISYATQSVEHSDYQTHPFTRWFAAGVHRIGVAFTNDDFGGGEDRNLLTTAITVTPAAGGAAPSLGSEAQWVQDMATREQDIIAATAGEIAALRMGSAEVRVTDLQGNPIDGAQVEVELTSHHFRFGANLFMFDQFGSKQQNDTYKAKFAEVFNFATVPFYWAFMEPVEGQPDYALTDAMAQWCEDNGIAMKGHAVLYGDEQMIPGWADGTPDTPTQLAHMEEVLARYPQIDTWDLVNEPFNAPGMDWAAAYRRADALRPADNLVINSYGQFYNGWTVFYANAHQQFHTWLEQDVIGAGVPFDTIGIQAHAPLDTAFPLELVQAHIDHYAALGKRIHLTEFMPTSSGAAVQGAPWRSTWTEAEQAAYAEAFYRVAFAHPAVDALTWWDVCDTGAWLPSGGLLRSNLTEKPVYTALKRLITEEWHTAEQGTTQAGVFAFDGYHGAYTINVSYAGETAVMTGALEPDDALRVFTLALDIEPEPDPEPEPEPEDTTPPQLTLLGPDPLVVEVLQGFADAGATAFDETDGDLTAQIVLSDNLDLGVVGTYTLTYSVADAAGNTASATLTVHVVDTTAPVLALLGSAAMTLEAGSLFVDPGATAQDAYAGDLSAAITVSGSVDAATPGTYTLTYRVVDPSGNEATATRTVTVTAAPPQGAPIGLIGDLDNNGLIEDWDLTLMTYLDSWGEGFLNWILRMRGMAQVDPRLADVDQNGLRDTWDVNILSFVLSHSVEEANIVLTNEGRPLAHVGEMLYE